MPVVDSSQPHLVLNQPLDLQPNDDQEVAVFGMGCFWGAERLFWQTDGVVVTAVGYTGGTTEHPTYREVCTHTTGHAEVVRIVFDKRRIDYQRLLELFFENHLPNQGMRQKNDVGSQYRSVIFATNQAQYQLATDAKNELQKKFDARGLDPITTEITHLDVFYFAEDEHQQYLAKNPAGYCSIGGYDLDETS